MLSLDMQKRIKVALIIFVDQDGDILLNKRADSKTEAWELIGGGIESGESAEEAIKREVYEELVYKIDAEKDGLALLDYFDYSDSRLIAQVSVFRAIYPGIENFSDSDEVFVKNLKLLPIRIATRLNLLPITKIVLERIKILGKNLKTI